MPKGKHKGGRRHFTDFEATEEERLKKEKEKQWRKNRGESDSDDEDGSEKSSEESEESESSEDESESKQPKAKGVSGLIQTENLNRQVVKNKKVSDLDVSSGKAQLSRKEKEEIEKQKAAAHYRKLHAAGKTEEARSDLERLAIIRQQREEAAKRKDEERKAREAAANTKKEQVAKALNKKTKS